MRCLLEPLDLSQAFDGRPDRNASALPTVSGTSLKKRLGTQWDRLGSHFLLTHWAWRIQE